MNKSTHFFGQSVFGQLISLIDSKHVAEVVAETQSDYCIKKFTTHDHLISMLFSTFGQCSSLREISGAFLGLKGKINHFQLKNMPYKSTLGDANKRRNHAVFEKIYYRLFNQYRWDISDSRKIYSWEHRLEIIDSTTISLFQDVLRCVGRNPVNGKRKGGIKVHTQMNLQQNVPALIWFSDAATHDKQFLKKVKLVPHQIAVFDKGYNDYNAFDYFTANDIFFVTRIKSNAAFEVKEEFDIPDYIDQGVIKDERIEVEVKENGKYLKKISLRRIAYWDEENKRSFEFLTNLFGMNAGHIALIYKQRWQIELLYKQLKQNFPLKYFLGDNENAIKIQIWCTLITNLLLTVIKKKLKRKWSYSNLTSFCRLHLFNYINLIKFLENPEKDWVKTESKQLILQINTS